MKNQLGCLLRRGYCRSLMMVQQNLRVLAVVVAILAANQSLLGCYLNLMKGLSQLRILRDLELVHARQVAYHLSEWERQG